MLSTLAHNILSSTALSWSRRSTPRLMKQHLLLGGTISHRVSNLPCGVRRWRFSSNTRLPGILNHRHQRRNNFQSLAYKQHDSNVYLCNVALSKKCSWTPNNATIRYASTKSSNSDDQSSTNSKKATTTKKPRKVTTLSIAAKKRRGEKITMVTAYDYPSAIHVDRAGMDVVLVGDSCAMVELGFETTQV